MVKGASVPDQALAVPATPANAVDGPSGFDPSRGDFMRCPAPPILCGGVKPTEWLLSMAAADDKKKAHARAREARAIAVWLRRLARWIVEEQVCDIPPAIVIETRPGGDAQQAPSRSDESTGRNGIAQDSTKALGSSNEGGR